LGWLRVGDGGNGGKVIGKKIKREKRKLVVCLKIVLQCRRQKPGRQSCGTRKMGGGEEGEDIIGGETKGKGGGLIYIFQGQWFVWKKQLHGLKLQNPHNQKKGGDGDTKTLAKLLCHKSSAGLQVLYIGGGIKGIQTHQKQDV